MSWLPASTRDTLSILYPDPGEADAFLLKGVRIALALIALVAVIFESGMATYYATTAGTFRRLASIPPKL
jgi:hypothetical protein